MEVMHFTQVRKLRKFFKTARSPLHRAIQKIDTTSPLRLSQEEPPEPGKTMKDLEQDWKTKALHGKYAAALQGLEVDAHLSTKYLRDGHLRTETEGFIGAIQDRVIATRNYRKYILKLNVPDDMCRMCSNTTETIQHLSSGCTYLAPRDYLDRHNKIAGILHQELCKKHKLISTTKPYYKYLPESVMENDSIKIYWDTNIITDRTVRHNRPDILLLKKKEKEAYIIDIAVPLDDNIKSTHTEKITKYQELANEIKHIYLLQQIRILPVIISSNGLVEKHLVEHLQQLGLSDHGNIIGLAQMAAILCTCSTIRRVLANQ